MSKFNVRGKTFDVKDELKAFGCRWNPDNKVWYFEADELPDWTSEYPDLIFEKEVE